jgi:DNA-directed RNA polymerase specialized sigma24 family protein
VRRYSSIDVVVIWVETPRNPESDRSPSPTLGVITDVETQTLALARAGDGAAFGELVEPYRRELQLHCYRILGSLQDAQDVLQETLLAAWRGLEGFQERASVRAWLYRIATNRCLNALRDRGRRPPVRQPIAEPPEPHPAR